MPKGRLYGWIWNGIKYYLNDARTLTGVLSFITNIDGYIYSSGSFEGMVGIMNMAGHIYILSPLSADEIMRSAAIMGYYKIHNRLNGRM